MAGKLVLLKATLDSLPIYWFNFFIMPKCIKRRLDIIRRNFLWGNNKIRLANWRTVTSKKQSGGLGVTNLEYRNIYMLGKYWWHVKDNKNSIGISFLKSKYGQDYNNWTSQSSSSVQSTFIKNMSYLQSHPNTACLFDNNNFY